MWIIVLIIRGIRRRVTYLNAAGTRSVATGVGSGRAGRPRMGKDVPHRMPESVYFDLPDRVRCFRGLMGGEPEEFAIHFRREQRYGCCSGKFPYWKPDDEVLLGRAELRRTFPRSCR